MNEKHQFPTSISHKKLTKFMLNAQKNGSSCPIDKTSLNSCEDQSCSELFDQWELISKEILLNLARNEPLVAQNKSSKSLMALGAMEAHLTMAIQALKASKTE